MNPCGEASDKYSPRPNPPPRSSRGQALQAGEGAVCGELTDLALNIHFCELPPVWICAEAFLLNAVPLRLQIFPGQQWAFAGMTVRGRWFLARVAPHPSPLPQRGEGEKQASAARRGIAARADHPPASRGTRSCRCRSVRRLPAGGRIRR